jgi:N-acyl-D-amino-acid deacylase
MIIGSIVRFREASATIHRVPDSRHRRSRPLLLPLALLLSACAPQLAPAPPSPAATYDIVIENGRVVDGTGAAWFHGDVAIVGDRIVRLVPRGLLRDAPARQRIDATGLVVSPGFIDIQSHSRAAFRGEGDGRVLSKVTQGITTEIMGEGTSDAIVNARMFPDPGEPRARAALERFSGPRGFEAWLRSMEAHGASVNVGSFLGGDNVRTYARGADAGAPTAAELDSMRKVVRWAMEGGAFGIATALIYPPSTFASTGELVEASRAMAPYGGVYITHMRSEGDRILEAIDEAVRIGREAGVPVEIYHLKPAGVRNWGKAEAMLQRIEAARRAGIDVQANMYPYTAGGTGLTACFPPWASEGNRLFERLADSSERARMRAEMLRSDVEWENLCELATPAGVTIQELNLPEHARFRGQRLEAIATTLGKDWIETALDLVLAERHRIGTLYELMSEENLVRNLRQPWMKFGTDAGGVDPESARGLVHPRAYGTFTRILGRYVREQDVIPLEDAIRKMTSAVTTRLSIPDRGLLREGFYADVVVFDPVTIADHATFEEPHQLSAGVLHVLVNGVAVVRDGAHTGARPGRALFGPGYRAAAAP